MGLCSPPPIPTPCKSSYASDLPSPQLAPQLARPSLIACSSAGRVSCEEAGRVCWFLLPKRSRFSTIGECQLINRNSRTVSDYSKDKWRGHFGTATCHVPRAIMCNGNGLAGALGRPSDPGATRRHKIGRTGSLCPRLSGDDGPAGDENAVRVGPKHRRCRSEVVNCVETSRRSVKTRPIYHYFTKEAEFNVKPARAA